MLVDFLSDEYTLESAISQIENAEIRIKNNIITVLYDNGVTDIFEVELIEKLSIKNR